MRDRDSAFATLGLRPGAARAEVDQAYRRLIKRHHPDHSGGDSSRAAEINQAYAQLRRPPSGQAVVQAHGPGIPLPRPRRARHWGIAFAGAVLVAALFVLAGEESSAVDQPWAALANRESVAPASGNGIVPGANREIADESVSEKLIDQSVADAMRLHARGDAAAMADFSRACISRLRDNPSWHRFDSCAAFDEAVGILETTTSGFDSGAFNPSAVTSRQVGAARLLSSDYLTAQSRLRQIRSRVHFTLLPQIPDARVMVEPAMADPLPALAPVIAPSVPESLAEVPAMPKVEERRRAPVRLAQSPRPAASARLKAAATAAFAPRNEVAPAPAPEPAAPAAQDLPAWQRPLPVPMAGNKQR